PSALLLVIPAQNGLVPRVASDPKLKLADPIRASRSSGQKLLLNLPVSMSSSFSWRFFCASASTSSGVRNSLLWFGRCTVASGCFRWLPLASLTGYRQRNCARARRLQFRPQVFDGTKQFARTQLRLDS